MSTGKRIDWGTHQWWEWLWRSRQAWACREWWSYQQHRDQPSEFAFLSWQKAGWTASWMSAPFLVLAMDPYTFSHSDLPYRNINYHHQSQFGFDKLSSCKSKLINLITNICFQLDRTDPRVKVVSSPYRHVEHH